MVSVLLFSRLLIDDWPDWVAQVVVFVEGVQKRLLISSEPIRPTRLKTSTNSGLTRDFFGGLEKPSFGPDGRLSYFIVAPRTYQYSTVGYQASAARGNYLLRALSARSTGRFSRMGQILKSTALDLRSKKCRKKSVVKKAKQSLTKYLHALPARYRPPRALVLAYSTVSPRG